MAKAKRISINEFEKVVKENYENVVVKEWHGIPVTITKTLPLKEMMALVSEVADNCFMDDGTYLPEVAQALLDCGVVLRYTNLSLPSNLSARYELLYQSGILNFVLPEINTSQYNDIVVAVRDKIDYICDSHISDLKNTMRELNDTLDQVKKTSEGIFANVSMEDFQNMREMLEGEGTIEERIVSAYVNNKTGENTQSVLQIVGEEK